MIVNNNKTHLNNANDRIGSNITCQICFQNSPIDKCSSLGCRHLFCSDCWKSHIEISISNGLSINIQCMEQNCFVKVTEEFVHTHLKNDLKLKKFDNYAFNEYLNSNPLLRNCPGKKFRFFCKK